MSLYYARFSKRVLRTDWCGFGTDTFSDCRRHFRMSSVLRVLIEESLGAMEGGRFQDFCLEFLPAYDARFAGLSRSGHTAAGKTRAGTPDLLKTLSDGQVAVQCGTGEDYWPPEDAIEGSKPYEDALSCLRALQKPVEIVLVTNREAPTHHPNVKYAIAIALRGYTDATITLLGLEDLSQSLVTRLDDRRVRNLVEKFCPIAASSSRPTPTLNACGCSLQLPRVALLIFELCSQWSMTR